MNRYDLEKEEEEENSQWNETEFLETNSESSNSSSALRSSRWSTPSSESEEPSITSQTSPMETTVGEVLEKHKAIWHKFRDYTDFVLNDPRHPNFGKRSYAIKQLAEAFKVMQMGERLAWGIKDEMVESAKIITVGFQPMILPEKKS